MRNFTALAVALGLLTAAAAAQPRQPRLRFFFDKAGAGEREPRTKDLSFENPSVAADIDEEVRFYMYIQYGNPEAEKWSMDLNVDIVGNGHFTDWLIYNNIGGQPRWNAIGNRTGPGHPVPKIVGTNMIAITRPGATNDPDETKDDFHFRNDIDFGTTLLGYIDVARTGEGDAEIYYEVGRGKIAPKEGGTEGDMVAFGFGDEPVGIKRMRRSTHWDARLTPEPTTLALLVFGALAALRRRR